MQSKIAKRVDADFEQLFQEKRHSERVREKKRIDGIHRASVEDNKERGAQKAERI